MQWSSWDQNYILVSILTWNSLVLIITNFVKWYARLAIYSSFILKMESLIKLKFQERRFILQTLLWNEICDYIATRYITRHNKCYSGFVKWMKSPHKDYIYDPTFRHSGLVSLSGVIWCWNSWPYILSRCRYLPKRWRYSCGKQLQSALVP